MLARIIRISLLLELAAYAALGSWLHSAHAWPLWILAVAVPLAALAARLALVTLTMALSWFLRSPRASEHRLGVGGTLKLVLGEWRALVIDNLFYFPFERQALRPDPAPLQGDGLAVVLVHGYFSNRGYFRPLAGYLERHGVAPLYTPNFRTVLTSIEDQVAKLHRDIERIAGRSGRVILVCHSMGGLAAREYLRQHGDARVVKLITIASPHHGTVLARFGVGANSAEMCPGCEFLAALEQAERAAPPTIPATSLYSTHDNLVVPQETSRLPWAKNVALPGLGHVAILDADRLFELVLDELGQARPGSR